MPQATPDHAAKILGRAPWLAGFERTLPAAMTAAGRLVQLSPGQWTQAEGDLDTGLVCVIAGAMQLYIRAPGDREVLIGHVEEGGTFGQTTRFGGGPRIATAIAVVPSVLLVVSDSALTRLSASVPDIWRAVAALAYTQLRAVTHANAELTALPPAPRIAARLLALAAPKGTRPPIALHLSQHALAELVGLTRKTVNAVLSDLESIGALKRGYNRLELLDLKVLRQAANA